MSIESEGATLLGGSAPELSVLGKHIELLRIHRGISKQQLARYAGTSRQQLWRVMTGKSELTSALCQRLAEVLQVDPRELADWCGGGNGRLYSGARRQDPDHRRQDPDHPPPAPDRLHDPRRVPASLAAYVADTEALLETLRSMPTDAAGRRLKREFLNCVELVAADAGLRLAPAFFRLRGRVINGEL